MVQLANPSVANALERVSGPGALPGPARHQRTQAGACSGFTLRVGLPARTPDASAARDEATALTLSDDSSATDLFPCVPAGLRPRRAPGEWPGTRFHAVLHQIGFSRAGPGTHVARATPRSRNDSRRLRNEPRNASPRIALKLFHFLRNLASWIGGHSGSEAEANGSLRRLHVRSSVARSSVAHAEFRRRNSVARNSVVAGSPVRTRVEERVGPGTRSGTDRSGVGTDRAAHLGVDVTMRSRLVGARGVRGRATITSVDGRVAEKAPTSSTRSVLRCGKPTAQRTRRAPSVRDNPRGWDVTTAGNRPS